MSPLSQKVFNICSKHTLKFYMKTQKTPLPYRTGHVKLQYIYLQKMCCTPCKKSKIVIKQKYLNHLCLFNPTEVFHVYHIKKINAQVQIISYIYFFLQCKTYCKELYK